MAQTAARLECYTRENRREKRTREEQKEREKEKR
jgi:hypothetical protein